MSEPSLEPEDRPLLMELLAERVGMTEGQLYTAILGVVLVVLLSLTGLPGAHQRSDADGFSEGSPVLELEEGAP